MLREKLLGIKIIVNLKMSHSILTKRLQVDVSALGNLLNYRNWNFASSCAKKEDAIVRTENVHGFA